MLAKYFFDQPPKMHWKTKMHFDAPQQIKTVEIRPKTVQHPKLFTLKHVKFSHFLDTSWLFLVQDPAPNSWLDEWDIHGQERCETVQVFRKESANFHCNVILEQVAHVVISHEEGGKEDFILLLTLFNSV